MNLHQGSRYILRFNVNGITLTYQGTIISLDENDFVTFIDKYGKELCYNLKILISSEEIK
jgi:hypothetical protein